MNRKKRRKLKRLFGNDGDKKGLNPYFVASSGFNFDKKPSFAHFVSYGGQGGDCHAEKQE